MRILGIETSCDETAAAVVEDGERLLSNVVASSMYLHAKYGGVVPEIAARSHIEAILPVINEALAQAKHGQGLGLDGVQGNGEQRTEPYTKYGEGAAQPLTQQSAKSNGRVASSAGQQVVAADDLWDSIDGIAVTYGAGLGGSLLIGVLTARTLAIAHQKPLYAINHVEGHVYANFLTTTSLSGYQMRQNQPEFPMLAIIVSGGHSQLALFRNHFDYTLLGATQDDAIGEAFDKVAKILGLPYPGGPSVAKAAESGDANRYELPKAKMGKYDFSFSGLKTAVLRQAQAAIGESYDFPSTKLPERLSEAQKADIAASFQRVAIETIVDKSRLAYEEFSPNSVVIAGGVAASQELRRQLTGALPLPIEYPDFKLCTDNGAMIATLGCFKAMLDQPKADPYSLDIAPNLTM
jgi:N6-L-threonylcarbamoyladenine synthase